MPPKKTPPSAPGVKPINFEDPKQAKFGCLLLNRFAKTIEHDFDINQDDWERWWKLTCSKSPLIDEVRSDLIVDIALTVKSAHPDCQMDIGEIQEEVLHLIDTLHRNHHKDPSEYNYALRYDCTDLDLKIIALGIYLHSVLPPSDYRVDRTKDFTLLDVIGDAMARTRHSIAYVMLDCHEEILDHHNRIADIVAEEGDIAYLLHDAEPKLTAAAEYYKMDIEERLDAEEEDAEEDTGDEGKKPGTTYTLPALLNDVHHEPRFMPKGVRRQCPLPPYTASAKLWNLKNLDKQGERPQ